MHEGGGRWVGSNKLVELKKKKKSSKILGNELEKLKPHCFAPQGESGICVPGDAGRASKPSD